MVSPPTVVVWVAEGTWQGCVDAARALAPEDARFVLLHVISEEIEGAAHGAYAGLLGRAQPGRDPAQRMAESAAEAGAALLAAAAARLGRSCSQVQRRGRTEQEVVAVAAGADLLVLARDGDRSRLGPKSLGKATRFTVDHAPCPVLLVWPGPAPSPGTIPAPPAHEPPGQPPPGPPHRPHHRPPRGA